MGPLGEVVATPSPRGDLSVVETLLPATRVQGLRRQLPGLTGGESVVETSFGGYEPVRGAPPTRRRTMVNPLDRNTYLARVARHASPPTNELRETRP